MKSWVKLYTEINRDPKMARLTWAQKGIWAALMALAGELDVRNGDGSENGELDTAENTAWRIRCDLPELSEAVGVFAECGMIETVDGVLRMTNYPKRQARPPSASREAVRQRVANHRERIRNEPVTTTQHEVTTLDTDTDTEKTQKGEEAETEVLRAPPFQQAVTIWEDWTGRITDRTRQQFAMAADEYTEERLLYAVQQAHDHNAKSWAYVEAVLEGRGRSPPGKVSIEDQWLAEQTDGE